MTTVTLQGTILLNENTASSDSELTFRNKNYFTNFLRLSRWGIGFHLRVLQAIKLQHISPSIFEYRQKVSSFLWILIQTRSRYIYMKLSVFFPNMTPCGLADWRTHRFYTTSRRWASNHVTGYRQILSFYCFPLLNYH